MLKNGKYQMMELPKNFGMYECRDLEVYAESLAPSDGVKPDRSNKPNKDDRIGDDCLIEKPKQN